MHRTLALVATLSSLATACADFDGESFDPVVEADEVEVRDELPEGYRWIGGVDADAEHTVDGNSLVEIDLWCDVDTRLLRRMKRVAARNGGELLFDVECERERWLDDSPAADDPETWDVETALTCSTWCTAEVARRSDRD
jgi:hypothetical protein